MFWVMFFQVWSLLAQMTSSAPWLALLEVVQASFVLNKEPMTSNRNLPGANWNTEWWFSFPRKSTWVMELWAELAGFFLFSFFHETLSYLKEWQTMVIFFKVEFFVSFNIADKIVRHLKCKMWSFDMCIHCERIPLIKLISASITSHLIWMFGWHFRGKRKDTCIERYVLCMRGIILERPKLRKIFAHKTYYS